MDSPRFAAVDPAADQLFANAKKFLKTAIYEESSRGGGIPWSSLLFQILYRPDA